MVFVTGDCHGEFKRFSTENFPQQNELTREEMDFGLASLCERGFKVDYIITHCCPQAVARGLDYEESAKMTYRGGRYG